MKDKNNISNVDIVLFSLYKLEGSTKKIHTEEIAWEAYNLSKERFSWCLPKFHKMGFPDKTTARYALESAKKIKYVTGRAGRDKGGSESEGWQLTSLGIEWIRKNEKRIAFILKQNVSLSNDLTIHEAKRFIKNIKSKKIYLLFKKDKSLKFATIYDFSDLLNCSPDAPQKVIKSQFYLLKNNTELLNDEELHNFINICENKFNDVLT